MSREQQFKQEFTQHLKKAYPLRSKRERNLSEHVYSRSYRPPEVILRDQNYDLSSDIWAIGCMLYELIVCSENNREDPRQGTIDRSFARGDSCYPMSPIYRQAEFEKHKDKYPDAGPHTISHND